MSTFIPGPPQMSEDDRRVLGWVREAVKEGTALLKMETAYNGTGSAIEYFNGRQQAIKQTALSRVTDNRIQKNLLEIVSSMTDVRPIWNYYTSNNKFKTQGEILNKIVRSWWRNSYSDRRLQAALLYSGVGGSGYLKVEWNPLLAGGGDIDLIPLDPRDVIPIRPGYAQSIQDWYGVVLRKRVSINYLRSRYPLKAYAIQPMSDTWFDSKRFASSGTSLNMNILSPALSQLFGLGGSQTTSPSDVDQIFCFIKDDTIHTGIEPKLMGKPGTNWAYIVYPVGSNHPITGKRVTEDEAKLYPRGRLIICTTTCVLDDMPNPYWHGLFPVVKVCLDPNPWSFLGTSTVLGAIPMQDALNEALRGLEDGIKKTIRPDLVYDQRAVAKSIINSIDTRRAGLKMGVNPTAGEGVKFIPGPRFDSWYLQYIDFMKNEIDDVMGVRGLKELAQLKQLPSADTVEKYLDAQSPILRLRSRCMEQSLAELAEQVKYNILQYYDVARRVAILGPDGATLEDFDYDPNNMIPSMQPGETDYQIEFDSNLTRVDRGTRFARNFTFQVTANSFINTTNVANQMKFLQLLRMNMLDPWTALEAFDVPNLGPMPPGSVFDRIKLAQDLGLMPGPPGPGRPPSGNQPPTLVTRQNEDGSSRPVVSESSRS